MLGGMSKAADIEPGPALPEARMHLYGPTAPAVGVVVRNERCTAGRRAAGFVRHIEIDVSGTQLAGAFLPGQSFGVIPPGTDEHGREHKLRLYSLASPSRGEDGQGRVVATTVKRLIDEHQETGRLFLGVSSNYLCDLKPGERVRLTGPAGKRFLLPVRPEEHDFVFFATGTGIAPFRGMLLELLRPASGPPLTRSRLVLVMGAPYASDLLYDPLLRELADQNPNFTYLTAISREPQADGHGPLYVQDRLSTHREMLGEILSRSRTLVYICGVAGMELGILQSMARILPASDREQYLRCDSETLAGVEGWTRRMLHKQLILTRRVFLEVY